MSFNPKISFILYINKNTESLEECLERLSSFDQNDVEIVIRQDQENDEANAILDRFFNTIRPNVVFVKNQEFLGQSFCFNSAINLCSGKYIYFMAYNDVLHENLLSEIEQPMNENYDVISLPSLKTSFFSLEKNEYNKISKELILASGTANLRDKIFRKEYLIESQLNFEVGKWYPDVFILNVLLSFNKWWNILGEPLVDIRKEYSVSFNLYDYLYQVEDLFDLAIKANVYEEFKKEFDCWIITICLYQFLSKIYANYSIHFTVKKSVEKNARIIRLAMKHVEQVISKYVPNYESNPYYKMNATKLLKYYNKSKKVM